MCRPLCKTLIGISGIHIYIYRGCSTPVCNKNTLLSNKSHYIHDPCTTLSPVAFLPIVRYCFLPVPRAQQPSEINQKYKFFHARVLYIYTMHSTHRINFSLYTYETSYAYFFPRNYILISKLSWQIIFSTKNSKSLIVCQPYASFFFKGALYTREKVQSSFV